MCNDTMLFCLPDLVGIVQKIHSAPLPTFTGKALSALTDGTPELAWKHIISQTSDYYYGRFPDIGDSSQYRQIGMKMYRQWPCIAQEGCHPWVTTLF